MISSVYSVGMLRTMSVVMSTRQASSSVSDTTSEKSRVLLSFVLDKSLDATTIAFAVHLGDLLFQPQPFGIELPPGGAKLGSGPLPATLESVRLKWAHLTKQLPRQVETSDHCPSPRRHGTCPGGASGPGCGWPRAMPSSASRVLKQQDQHFIILGSHARAPSRRESLVAELRVAGDRAFARVAAVARKTEGTNPRRPHAGAKKRNKNMRAAAAGTSGGQPCWVQMGRQRG